MKKIHAIRFFILGECNYRFCSPLSPTSVKLVQKSQTSREAGAESHGSLLKRKPGCHDENSCNPVFCLFNKIGKEGTSVVFKLEEACHEK